MYAHRDTQRRTQRVHIFTSTAHFYLNAESSSVPRVYFDIIEEAGKYFHILVDNHEESDSFILHKNYYALILYMSCIKCFVSNTYHQFTVK